ncbi:MAG: 3-oxoacyl-ACP reductase FabG [Saprospiraceae bacterium]|jgi:3-oxoacyl-[acyl-carrier protein] reductase|nr:3-oxoacyl-ACP reductase FabG [Candidatus Defluviibacterium haderslevense]MBK7242955.1 3-oxoacyl-ACP reductase FabG [Candidatus Defluviibacterium haderslevense]HRI32307.1 3-oxoacyl-ACP reductase FabG [Saprospiraceae bacterium]
MKYALITGGSRGIGRAVCYKLAEMKYHILLNYINNDDEAQITKEQIMLKGVNCELIKFDVSDKEACEQILGTWIENNKDNTIEVLVNNAGKRQDNLFVWMTDLQWKEVISTSLDSFFYVTRLVLNKMVHQRHGRIINMASLSGLKGNAGQTNYSAAKAGLIGATKALAQEVARRGVTVNVVAPGFIRTDMTQDLNEKQLSEIIPMRRFGTPEEVAEVVGFLASSGASYISGEVISVNGALYS